MRRCSCSEGVNLLKDVVVKMVFCMVVAPPWIPDWREKIFQGSEVKCASKKQRATRQEDKETSRRSNGREDKKTRRPADKHRNSRVGPLPRLDRQAVSAHTVQGIAPMLDALLPSHISTCTPPPIHTLAVLPSHLIVLLLTLPPVPLAPPRCWCC